MAITKKQRKEVEDLIYQTMSILDKTNNNTEYYQKQFSKMSDEEFEVFFRKDYPIRRHHIPWVTEPSTNDVKEALDFLGVPFMERINLAHNFKNKDGQPVMTMNALVVYLYHKRLQQSITKKNSMSTDVSMRDMKTGALVSYDKNGKTSDREMESLIVNGFDSVVTEFKGPRADEMDAKSQLYNLASTNGIVSEKEVQRSEDDSIAKNTFNTYLLGACLNSNILNKDNYLPYTLKTKQRKVTRV